MIRHPYKDIRDSVVDVLKPLIPESDKYNSTHIRRHARTLETLLDAGISGKVLELGTSSVIPLSLNSLVSDLQITVTDFNASRPKVGKITLGDSLQVDCYSIDLESEPIPVEDETFDFVICSEVVEHLDVDPMYMMSEINRVLKTGGTLILTTPNACSTLSIWKILRGYEPYFYMQYQTDRSPYRHNYEYSPRSLIALLNASGFAGKVWTEDSFADGTYEDVIKLRQIGYALQDDLIGDNIFSVSKKVSEVRERYPRPIYDA
jgi:ubiquinone/menaquinone biosynthesis C-methylase UbiE